uniref:DNA ligase n=1 Tax=Plectus sambesii TaxID=2011161 RepID=A0A914UKU5_9BILA
MANVRFGVDYAKRVSNCKKCKQQLGKGEMRVAKITPNPFASDADSADMRQYFHAQCVFETFNRVRAGTKTIESAADVEAWSDLTDDDKKKMLDLIAEREKKAGAKKGGTKAKADDAKKKQSTMIDFVGGASKAKAPADSSDAKDEKSDKLDISSSSTSSTPSSPSKTTTSAGSYDSWSEFCKLCDLIASVSKYTDKSAAVEKFLAQPGFDGDVYLLMKLLLPGADHRVYNLKEKQLIKLFANIFALDADEMTDHFNQCGDVSDTISEFVGKSASKRAQESALTIQEVDEWLDELTKFTRDNDQQKHLAKIAKKSTPSDLLYVIRLIKKDLRINAGAKHILEGLNSSAYQAFQASRDLRTVVDKALAQKGTSGSPGKQMSISIKLGVPVLPMLAEACRSVEQAMKRCPNGMYSEIKYDGERVQLHKHGDTFTYYSRSLKPVQRHKVELFAEFIPKAFPGGGDLILDAEVLMIDTNTGKPLPFGTLGVHKKQKFDDAVVCLFVFDCLLFKGESLMDRPLKERKDILEKHMTEIPNHVMLSNYELIDHGDKAKLKKMIFKAIDEGLEGLVLKDTKSIYEPGKRHWLKVKKDYLEEGKMADTADLLVLGAYYGTGNKGGTMSVFLMGVHDPSSGKFLTVTKCGNGHDDAQLERINKQLSSKMTKISKDADKLPSWFKCSRSLVPDFVMKDPKQAVVWEITGAEFSKSENHTADGVSIRFPRVTRIRDDKDWQSATNLNELKKLYNASKEKTDFDSSASSEDSSSEFLFGVRKRKAPPVPDTDSDEKDDDIKPQSTKNDSDDQPSPPKKAKNESDQQSSPQKKANKESDLQTSPRKKAKKECRYGASCYQKNPAHREQFSHPNDKNTKAASSNDEDEEKSFFANQLIFLSADVPDRKTLARYVVYYGGDLVDLPDAVDPEQDDDVTFVLNGNNDKAAADVPESKRAKKVSVDWLKDCVKERKLLTVKKYLL